MTCVFVIIFFILNKCKGNIKLYLCDRIGKMSAAPEHVVIDLTKDKVIKLSGQSVKAVKVSKLRQRIMEKKKQLIDPLMKKIDSLPLEIGNHLVSRQLLRKITSIPTKLRPHHITPKLIMKLYELVGLEISYNVAYITELLKKHSNGELQGVRVTMFPTTRTVMSLSSLQAEATNVKNRANVYRILSVPEVWIDSVETKKEVVLVGHHAFPTSAKTMEKFLLHDAKIQYLASFPSYLDSLLYGDDPIDEVLPKVLSEEMEKLQQTYNKNILMQQKLISKYDACPYHLVQNNGRFDCVL